MESGVEQSVVVGYSGQPLLVGAQIAVPVFPQVVCATQWKEDEEMQHHPDGQHRSFGLDGGVDGEHFMLAIIQHLEGQQCRG